MLHDIFVCFSGSATLGGELIRCLFGGCASVLFAGGVLGRTWVLCFGSSLASAAT